MTSINKLSTKNVVLDNVLKYKSELQNQFAYIRDPDKASQRHTHLAQQQIQLQTKYDFLKTIEHPDRDIYTLKRGLEKSNTKIKELEDIDDLKQQAATTNIFYKIILIIKIYFKEAVLGYSTTDLPKIKQTNQSIQATLKYLQNLPEKGALFHSLLVVKNEKNEIARLNISLEDAITSAKNQLAKDIDRFYAHIINGRTYANDSAAVISELEKIADAGMGQLVLFQLSNQTLPSLLKNIVQYKINELYDQTPENAQYIVQDLSQSKEIRITEKNGAIHLDLTLKYSVQNPNKEEYYQMDASMHLELNRQGNILLASLNVEPTS